MQLYPYQQAAVDHFFRTPAPHRLVFPFPTGSGKTAAAIRAVKAANASKILVICPAPVRRAWRQEFLTWWPNIDEESIGIINCGPTVKKNSEAEESRKMQAYAAPIKIVSPELSKNLVGKYDFVILDEAHIFRRSTSQQSRFAAAIMGANVDTPALALTATQIPNDVKDLWHPLHLLWPGKWGKPSRPPYEGSYQFNLRYSLLRTNEYGSEWYGLNPAHEAELREKLSRACHYVSREDVAPFLPKSIVRRWEIPADADRVRAILDWTEEALREGTHVSIQVYQKASARNLTRQLAKKFGRYTKIFTITGDIDPDSRARVREQWVSASRGILVSTMMSFGIGVSLTKADRALIAELWYVPGDLQQLLGRYARADKAAATPVDILIRSGSAEERIAEIVIRKARDIELVTCGNQSMAELGNALETPILEGAALADMTRQLLLSWDDEAEALLDD